VINLAWLGDQISEYLQDGKRFGAKITYSRELSGALETAGGIIKALPLLTDTPNTPFLVVNGDVYCDIDFSKLPELEENQLAHICLVDNPSHNLKGDFCLNDKKVMNPTGADNRTIDNSYTFSGIGLYRPEFFSTNLSEEVSPLAPLLRYTANNEQLAGSVLHCTWVDVGTPERLELLNQLVKGKE